MWGVNVGGKRPWSFCSDTEYLYSFGESRFDDIGQPGATSLSRYEYQNNISLPRKPNGDADVEMISIGEDFPPSICQQEACVSPIYQNSSWVVWTASGPRDTNKLCSFLQLFKPSISRAGVKWISVNTTRSCHASSRPDRPRSNETQEEALRSILKKPVERLSSEVKAECLKRLQDSAANTCGNWHVRCKPSDVDRVWSRIATDVVLGQLGPGATVSALDDATGKHTIRVYVVNFRDARDAERILRRLLQATTSVVGGLNLDFMSTIKNSHCSSSTETSSQSALDLLDTTIYEDMALSVKLEHLQQQQELQGANLDLPDTDISSR